MKLLITGATGYIGLRLVRAAQASGHQVFIAGRASGNIFFDLSKPQPVVLPEKFDAALHLAAITSSSATNPDAEIGGSVLSDSQQVGGKYKTEVSLLMDDAKNLLRSSFMRLGALMLRGSFTLSKPGGDIHHACSLPMRENPTLGETDRSGGCLAWLEYILRMGLATQHYQRSHIC